MSAFAIVLGVAFVAGALIFTDTLSSSFSQLFGPDGARMSRCVPRRRRRRPPAGHRRRLENGAGIRRTTSWQRLDGVERANGNITNQGTYIIGRDGKVVGSGGGAPGIGGNFGDARTADGSTIVTVLPGGAAPDGPNQVVIDEKSAATAGFQIGDTVQLVTTGAEPAVTATMVGTVRFGETGNLIGAPWPCSTPRRRNGSTSAAPTSTTTSRSPATAACRIRRCATRSRRPCRRTWKRWTTPVRCREPGPAGAGAVVHHHVPAGVRRRCAGGRQLPDPEHVLDHRGAAHPRAGPVPRTGRFEGPGHQVGVVGGAGGRAGGLDRRSGPGFRPGGRTAVAVRVARHRPRGRPGWSSNRARCWRPMPSAW